MQVGKFDLDDDETREFMMDVWNSALNKAINVIIRRGTKNGVYGAIDPKLTADEIEGLMHR